MAESDLSSEVNATTPLPASVVDSVTATSDSVTVSWTVEDNSPDGTIDVERSTDGFGASTLNGKTVAYEQDQYGTWVCVLNYEHYGGTNPTVSPGSEFPQLPNGLATASDVESSRSNGELRHVDNIDQYGAFEVDAVRLEATTTNHSRKIHFFTTDQTVIDATFTEQSDETDYTDFQGSPTALYDDHTANLPAAAGNGDADRRSDRLFGSAFPFFNGGRYHWAVKGTGNRWAVDDYPIDNGSGYQHSTVHRVWVRVTGATEATVLDNAVTAVASALPPTTTSYTDTSVAEGTTYEYRIERNTDHATATSGTAETTLFVRSLTGDGAGDATIDRSKTTSRETTADGAGRASVSRVIDSTRSVLGVASRGDASVSRTASTARTVIGDGSGNGVSARTATMARDQTAEGSGAAIIERALSITRNLTGEGDRGAASVIRSSSLNRELLGSGAGQSTVTRTFASALNRSALGDASGDAAVSRITTPTRTLTAESDRGDAAVSRLTTAVRSVLADGNGDAAVAWVAPDAWALPQTPGSLTDVLLTPSGVETDYESIALTATVSEAKREFLAHYRRAGDAARQTTAFGAFRRIRRDGDDLLSVRPPASDSPPFAERRVAPVDMSADQVAPRRHEVSLTLGLEEPRAREPIAGDGEALTVDSESLDLAAGASETVTLSWTPDGSQLGDWGATVSSETDSDAQLVTVSDAPWTFAWPVATLSLTESRVGQVQRGSETGVPSVTLPVRLDASQVATLLAVGSRIEAVELRQVPDAGNVAVDTLPGDELSCTLGTPTTSRIEAGTYVLRDWSVAYARAAPPSYDAEITLVRTD
jgi:hypothetical protein